MAEVGSAYLSILPSAKGFASSLSGQLGGMFTQAGQQGGGQLTDAVGATAGGKMDGLGKGLAGGLIAGFVAAGATQIASAVTQWISDAVSSASDLEQSLGGVDAVFKENADTIHAWAQGAAEDLGLSQNSYNELATIIGSQLKNMGMDMDDVTGQTGDLIGLGADLAAQFGGSTSDAVSALSSLLRGERDPIEAYGVSITQAAIDAEKARLGLEGLTGEAERNADVQATLSLLTQQTADAQGAFARESDTLAGQQARVTAEFENMKTEVGMALLPVVSQLFGVFQDTGLPLLRMLVDFISQNEDAIIAFGNGAAMALLSLMDFFLNAGEGAAMMVWGMTSSFRTVWNSFRTFIQNMLDGAAAAFGWIPGIGDRLEGAADDFRDFSSDVDDDLAAVEAGALGIAQQFRDGQDVVHGLQDAISGLPTDKTVRIGVTATGNGISLLSGGGYRIEGSGGPDFRASGGPVVAGRPYIVGEREPELFVPGQSGMIYNQQQLADMAGTAGQLPPVTIQNYGVDANELAMRTESSVRSFVHGQAVVRR